MQLIRITLAACLAFFIVIPLRAVVHAASLFGDNLVLQRAQPVPVWGDATPGEAVKVTFAEQSVHTVTDRRGQWRVRLKPLTATAVPSRLVIAGTNTLTFSNVVVGEVWVCSGQSNMEWSLGATENAAYVCAAADDPLLRVFTVAHACAFTPQDSCQGSWSMCTPQSAGSFSAVGYYFARRLREKLQVPVGLINASFGGTRAESWISLPGMRELPSFRQQAEQYTHAAQADSSQLVREQEAARNVYADRRVAWYRSLDARDPGITGHWMAPATDITHWRKVEAPCAKTDNPLGSFTGSLWFRIEVEIPAAWVGQPLTLHLGAIDETDDTYVNGIHVGRTWFETPEFWKVSRVYPVPATVVMGTHVTLCVRVLNLYYDTGLYGPADEMKLELRDAPNEPPISLTGVWCYTDGLVIGHGEIPQMPPAAPPANNPGNPAALFNGMIHPLIPYAIRGVIWYQGESNANADAYGEYHELFSGLITSWRRAWRQGDFPFAYVQLANYLPPQRQPVEKASWAELRQAQDDTLALRNTIMAVTIDIGEANNIHPKNKEDVGKRLALGVLATTYQQDIPLYSGPRYASLHVQGTAAQLRFSFSRGLICTGDHLTGFAIAGDDRCFYPAQARLVGETVVVWSDRVPKPVAVRYGWANNPPCNLANGAGLPAAPFRTDRWADFGVAN